MLDSTIQNNLISFVATLNHPRGYEYQVKLNPIFRQFVDNYWNDNNWGIPKHFLEKLWYAVHNKTPICDKGNRLSWHSWKKGYVYCDKRCECAIKAKEQTMLDKHGVKQPFLSELIRNKAKNTWLEKYGTDELSKINPDKRKHTNLERFGVEYPLQSKEIRNMISKTLFTNSGYITPFNNPKIQKTIQNGWLSLNGKKAYQRNKDDALAAQLNLLNNKFGDKAEIVLNKELFSTMLRTMSRLELANFVGCSDSLIDKRIKEWKLIEFQSAKSHYEIVIGNFLKSLNINYTENTRKIISPKEIDWWLSDYNLGIEFCGLRWHSEHAGRGKDYHLNKLTLMNKLGYNLIQIFQDEWDNHSNVIKNSIITNLKYFDKLNLLPIDYCHIIELTNEIADCFLLENQLEYIINNEISLGLMYNDELVSVATFRKIELDYWELSKFTNKIGYVIDTAQDKLISSFINLVDPDKIVYYQDRRYITDNSLKSLGFNLNCYTSPNYWYINGAFRSNHPNILLNQLANDDKFNKLVDNQKLKLDKIWDCGYEEWIWKKGE